MDHHYHIGLDLGGTKVATGLVDATGRIVAVTTLPTLAEKGLATSLAQIKTGIRTVIDQAGVPLDMIDGIGVGVPGSVDYKKGIVIHAPNIGWKNVPLRQILYQDFKKPVWLDYDTNVAALGEFEGSAVKDRQDMLFVIVGTGVGSGLIINGRLYRGATGVSGEIGHMIMVPGGIRCTCGNCGCLQMYAKGPAIASAAESALKGGADDPNRLQQGEHSLLEAVFERQGHLTGADVIQAAKEGDPLAKRVFAKAMSYLGLGIANAVSLINPGLVVLGGGIAKSGDLVLNPVREIVTKSSYPEASAAVKVRLSELWENAAILGAARLYTTFHPEAQIGIQ